MFFKKMYGTTSLQVKFYNIFDFLNKMCLLNTKWTSKKIAWTWGDTEFNDYFCWIIENQNIIHSVQTFSKVFKMPIISPTARNEFHTTSLMKIYIKNSDFIAKWLICDMCQVVGNIFSALYDRYLKRGRGGGALIPSLNLPFPPCI